MSTPDPHSNPTEFTPEQVVLIREHLGEVIASPAFAGSKRSQDFLNLIVGHALEGRWDNLRERMIGAEMFGRPIDYDTANDAVVRVKATEVRKKLRQYYLGPGMTSSVRIELPMGSYVPQFQWSSLDASTSSSFDSSLYEVKNSSEGENYTEKQPVALIRQVPNSGIRTSRILVGIVIAALLVAVYVYTTFRRENKSLGEAHAVAVLPLQNLSGDPSQEYFADGMTEELIADLGQVSALSVVSRTSVMTYKGTKKTLPEIARELKVDEIVEGSVYREGGQVRINAQLIDARSDRHLWSESYVRDLSNVLSLQGEVAQAIADEIRVKVTPQELVRLTRIRKVVPEAQDKYLKASELLNISDPRGALAYLQAAVQIDPNYAQAHAALANTYGWVGSAGWMPYSVAFPLEKAEAIKAIQLDDALADGHIALGNAAMNLSWDWTTQEVELKRALELNPNAAAVHWAYSDYLEQQGRFPEALSESNLALRLDPISSRAYTHSAFTYYFSRQYDEALSQLERADKLPHKQDELFYPSAVIYVEQGFYSKAIHELQQQGEATHTLGHMGNAYARMGDQATAHQIILKLEAQVRERHLGQYEIAIIYAGLNDKDEAFARLERALEARDKGLTYLKIDPCLDPLRSDSRFRTLEQRVGLRPD